MNKYLYSLLLTVSFLVASNATAAKTQAQGTISDYRVFVGGSEGTVLIVNLIGGAVSPTCNTFYTATTTSNNPAYELLKKALMAAFHDKTDLIITADDSSVKLESCEIKSIWVQ